MQEEMMIKNLTTGSYLGKISIAQKTGARIKGLLGTRALFPFQGLMIRPCKQVHTIGMLYPISVWYVDNELRVLQIIDRLQPFRIAPYAPESCSIIEFPEYWADKTTTREGDVLEFYQ